MASKKPPKIVDSKRPSLLLNMTTVVYQGYEMSIRKEEVEVWNRLSRPKKRDFVRKYKKLVEQGRINIEKDPDLNMPLAKK